jgi:hypothetical protein
MIRTINRTSRPKAARMGIVMTSLSFLAWCLLLGTTQPEMLSVSSTRTSTSIQKTKRQAPSYCQWSPTNSTDCETMISKLVAARDNPRRVLLLGDSTMGPDFLFQSLRSSLMGGVCPARYDCRAKEARRCNNNGLFGLDTVDEWRPPIFGEGPVNKNSPFCTDCTGCKSTFLECRSKETPSSHTSCEAAANHFYGGYLAVEFARDVEMQSANYATTQENLFKSYIPQYWNAPALVQDFGKPVCIVGTGFHDMVIPGVTFGVFLENVHWYLSLLQSECSLILWLANSAPGPGFKYYQTRKKTLRWNEGVRRLLRRNFSEIGFVDVYAASLDVPHRDHLHLAAEWYKSLAKLFNPQQWYSVSAS